MLNLRKKILSIAVIFLSTLFVFIACGKNVYKNLKLELSFYEKTIVLTNDPDEDERFFTITSQVTGLPKSYNGEVTATLSTPGSRSVLQFVDQTQTANGKTDFTYEVISTGRAEIDFITKQGNKRAVAVINVVKDLESISFVENTDGLLPIPTDQSINLNSFIKLNPSNTTQKDVLFEISLPESASEQEINDLNAINLNGGVITIPNSTMLNQIILTATSTFNPEVTASTIITVVKGIDLNEIDLLWDARQPDLVENHVSLKTGANYSIELAKNNADFALKRIYFNFREYDINNYEINVHSKSSNHILVNKIASEGINGVFEVSSVTEGNYVVEFEILPKEYKTFTQLSQKVKLNIKVVSYPDSIELINPETNAEIDSIVLYDAYSDRKGTPVKINVHDNTGVMQNQFVSFNLSNLNYQNPSRILLFDEFGRQITANQFNIKSGDIVYVSHNLESAEQPPQDLKIIFKSQTFGEVTSELLLNFERGIINLSTDSTDIRLDLTKENQELGFEHGYYEVSLNGLPSTFNYNNLQVVVDNENLVGVYKTDSVIAFYGKGLVGRTSARIFAPNGSSIKLDITAFEALSSETTSITVANKTFNSVNEEQTVAQLRASGYVLTLRNNLQAVNVNFAINGEMQAGLPSGILTSIIARDIIGGAVSENSMSVVNVRSNTNQLRTLNINGSSLVTVALTGYNEDGERNQNLYFKFIIDVEVPVDYIQLPSTANIYDQNLLSVNEHDLGVYTIAINTFPVNSFYEFEDMSWSLYHKNIQAQSTVTQLSNSVQYRFTFPGTSSFVYLTVNKNNIRQAIVETRLANNANDIENFNLTLSINRPVPDETGQTPINYVVPSAQIRFSAIKPEKVNHIVLGERDNVISFDSRKLAPNSLDIFEAPKEVRQKVISFTTLPANAKNVDLGVRYLSSAINVSVDNARKEIIIEAISKTTGRILVEIYAKDSEFSQGVYNNKVELFVEILDGSAELPFKIETVQDLKDINQDLTAHYVLTNNINISSTDNWVPIGYRTNSNNEVILNKFTGSLNGEYTIANQTYNYTISGLRFANGAENFNYNYVGLFAVVGETGVVKNINFTNVSIHINENQHNKKNFAFVGVIAGLNEGSVLNNTVEDGNGIEATGANEQMFSTINKINDANSSINLSSFAYGIKATVIESDSSNPKIVSIGGVVGVNLNELTDNKSYVLINYNDSPNIPVYAGGLAGINMGKNAVITNNMHEFYEPISQVFNVVSFINVDKISNNQETIITNENSATGGLVGFNTGVIENYTVRAVILKANRNVGGLVGFSAGTQVQETNQDVERVFAKIYNNLSAPTISGEQYVGGLIGYNKDTAYILQEDGEGNNKNYLGIKEIEGVNSNSEVVFNKVEFLNLINHQTSIYNTAIIARNYAGGLIGGVHKTFNDDHRDGNGSYIETAVHSNTVFSYYANQSGVANYFGGNNNNNGSYFGDILLLDNHPETNSNNSFRNVAGGLVGISSHFGMFANNEIFVNIQAKNAIIGGVLGAAYSAGSIKPLVIVNTSVSGIIANKQILSTVDAVTGVFVGDATNIIEEYFFDVYAKNYLNGQAFSRGFVGGKTVNYTVNYSIASVKNENGENITKVFGLTDVENATHAQYNLDTVFVQDINESDENFKTRLLASVLTSYNIHTQLTNDNNLNGIRDDLDALVQTNVNTLLESNPNFYNVAGLSNSEIEQKKNDIINKINESLQSSSINTVWYLNNSLNSGMPVLLSINRFTVDFNISNNVLNYSFNISMQTNWPPKSISITPVENFETVFNHISDEPVTSVVLYHSIHEKHYIPNNPNRLLNFNDNSLSEAEIELKSIQVHNELKELNTYKLSDLVNITTDGVIGLSSVMVKSSNPSVLSVETSGSNIVLVAKGTGKVSIEIYSTYNNQVNKTFNLDVVGAVLPSVNNLGTSLFKYNLNNLTQLNKTDNVSVIKSSNNYTNTTIIRARQQNQISLNGYTFDMPINLNGGVRYYILSPHTNGNLTGYSIYDDNGNATYPIKINNMQFAPNQVNVAGQTKYVYYVDVPHGADASISSNEIGENYILAVPYVLDSLSNKVVLINEFALNTLNPTFNTLGIVSVKDESGVQILQEFNFANQLQVDVLLGTRDLYSNIKSIAIEPIGNANFVVEIDTDNYNELLFLTYENQEGAKQTTLVDNRRFNNGSFEIDYYDVDNQRYSTGFNSFTIEDIDVYVEYEFRNGVKTYNFSLSVSENKRINNKTFKTITEEFLTTLDFFVLENANSAIIEFSDNSQTPSHIDVLNGAVFESEKISLKLTPQQTNNVLMVHYPNGDIVATENGGEVIYSDEASYDNILPGRPGILKINVIPYFASFDYIEITASATGGFEMSFEQLLAHYNSSAQSYDAMYTTVQPFAQKINNGIRLTKQSYLSFKDKDEDGNKIDRVYESGVKYDGMFYLRTLISSHTTDLSNFVITVRGFVGEGENRTVAFTKALNLDVIIPPSINLSYNGGKEAPLAIGTIINFDAELRGLSGRVDFYSIDNYSYIQRVDGSIVQSGLFSINPNGANRYQLSTSLNINPGDKLFVNGVVSQTINGETNVYKDTLVFTFANFTINSISVQNVVGGEYYATFGEINDLAVVIDASHNSSLPGVKNQIAELAKYWSRVTDVSNNNVWYYVNSENDRVLIRNAGYNHPNNTYAIYIGALSSGVTGLKIQNTTLNATDIIGARVRFVYDHTHTEFGGIKPVSEIGALENVIELTNEFTFNLIRDTSEDRPEPIRTVQDLQNMQSGQNYILLQDLQLDNWVPLNVDISSLDGNGYVLTIRSFNLPQRPASSNELVDGNIGIFSEISENTIIKNLTIEVMPSSLVSISGEVSSYSETDYVDLNINANAFRNINLGLLAGVNKGVVTNTVITHDASQQKLERDLLLYKNHNLFPNDPDVNSKYVNNFDLLLKDNFNKYFPRQKIVNPEATLWDASANAGEGEVNYANIQTVTRRDLSVVRVLTWVLPEGQTHNMATLVGVNQGFITNSGSQNISISGRGYVAGLVARNENQISTSFFNGGNIINRSSTIVNAATAGLVVHNTGSINYAYVMGREGDGNLFQYGIKEVRTEEELQDLSEEEKALYNIKVLTPSNNSDKTGLGQERKSTFAGSEYNKYIRKTNSDGIEYDTDFKFGALRAMNSSISSGAQVAGFVYQNMGEVSNSYANILLDSSKSSAGFVFRNESNAKITDVYTLSSVPVESRVNTPFTGVNDTNYEVLNSGLISFAYYLQGNEILFGSNDRSNSARVFENFANDSEVATELNYTGFSDYNSFHGFAFNPDYSSNEDLTRSVWFIPNGLEISNNNTVLNSFKKDAYLQFRPELVAANLNTLSVRRLSDSSSEVNNYRYLTSSVGTSILNPRLISSATEFNKYVEGESRDVKTHGSNVSGNHEKQNTNYIRFIKNIDFNSFETYAKTYAVNYVGDLDGNGMSINNLRLVSDNDFETEDGGNLENLGLFGSIKGVYELNEDDEKEYVYRGNVRNLNINVGEVRGSKVTSVGVLAGTIENATVSNIKVSGAEIVQGRNIVGGLAGTVLGDSEVVNITINGIGANANYVYSQENPFSARNNDDKLNTIGTFTTYNSQMIGERVTNSNQVSYAGGAIGVLDVDEIAENRNSTLRSARVRKISVSGSANVVAEIVGGVIGGVAENSVALDLDFEVLENSLPRLSASRVVGGIVGDLRGVINRTSLRHATVVQNSIDNSVANQANSNSNVITSPGLNYNNLFSARNPIYMGGIAGMNIGGEIRNSQNRVNVVNINAMFGGGVVGLNIGGALHNIHTTASVSAFKSVGGVIGLQVQNNFVKTTYTHKGANGGDYEVIDLDENLFRFVGEGNGEYTKEITLNQTPDNEFLKNVQYLDINNSNIKNPTTPTAMSGVVAANIWREQDVRLDNIERSYGARPTMGGIVGRVLLGTRYSGTGTLKYSLSDAFVVDGALDTSSREINDVNYFNQLLINSSYGLTTITVENLMVENLMREVGAINTTNASFNNLINSYTRSTLETNVLIGTKGLGRSGNRTNTIEGGKTFSYHYSRLQNLSSGRTIREIIARVYMTSEAAKLGISVTPDNPTDNLVVELPKIYHKWPINYWKGVSVNKLTAGGYEKVDPNIIFPQLVPVADLSIVYVYDAEDLALTTLYKNATFILMNDIDISGVSNWESSGDDNLGFGGRIISYSDEPRTISGLTINNTGYNNYLGLVGYAENALFSNFNLEVTSISITDTSGAQTEALIYIGSLFGSGTKNTIQNVHISSARALDENDKTLPFILSSTGVGAIGGIAGISTESFISNVSVTNGNVVAKTLHHNPIEKQNFVGGAVGHYSYAGNQNIEMENIIVDDVLIYVGKDLDEVKYHTNHSNNEEERNSLKIGGVFGEISNKNTLGLITGHGKATIENIKFINPRAFDVNITHEENIKDSNLKNVYIGGIAGISSVVLYNDVKISSAEEDGVEINLHSDYFNNSLYLGGVFGDFIGSLPSSTLEDLETIYNLENVNVDNTIINYSFKNRQTDAGDLTGSKVYIGGAIGKSSGLSANDAVVESEINLIQTAFNSKIANELYIGGFASISQTSHRFKSVLVNTNINAKNTYALNANKMFVGGVFGRYEGVHITDFETDFGVSEVGVAGDINIENFAAPLNVGGVFGLLNSAKVSKVISNANISLSQSGSSNISNVGGLIGNITNKNDSGSAVNTKVENSYSTGDIVLKENNDKTNIGAVVGVITSTDETENSGVVLLENLYSISNILSLDYHVYQNSYNSVGAVGLANFLDENANSVNTNKIKVHNVFYMAELLPNTNGTGTGLLIEENNKMHNSLNTAEWINSNFYPVLDLTRFENQTRFISLQENGTRQNPIVIEDESVTIEGFEDLKDKTFVVLQDGVLNLKAKTGVNPELVELNSTKIFVLYGGEISSLGVSHIDNKSIIYNVKNSANTISSITKNHGKIIGAPVSLEENNGLLLNVSLNIAENNSIIHKSKISSIDLNNGVVLESEINSIDSNNNLIINSYHYTAENKTIYTNNGSKVSLSLNDLGSINFNLSNSNLDFINTFAIFPNSDVAELQSGYPVLRWMLKDHWLDSEIKQTYLWAHEDSYVFGGYENGTYSGLVAEYENISVININNINDLAKVAFAASVGVEEVETSYDSGESAVNQTGYEIIDSAGKGIIKKITTTSFNLGVKTVATKYVLDFNGYEININSDIDLKNKLWTPIGFSSEVGLEKAYDSKLATNLFAGRINGGGNIIANMSAFSEYSSGLFGAAEVKTAGTILGEGSFAYNLVMQGGYSFGAENAGGLVGRLYNNAQNHTSVNYIASAVGVQKVQVKSNHIASGIFGHVVGSNINNNNRPALFRVYANTNVVAPHTSAGLAYITNQTGGSENLLVVNEVYYAGNVQANAKRPISNAHVLLQNAHAYYSTSAVISGANATYISATNLATTNFKGFNWDADGEWLRHYNVNDSYPIFDVKSEYWYKHTETPSQSGGYYIIEKPEHLAYISAQSQGVNGFVGNIRLANDIDLKDKLWTPINKFTGIFDGNNKTINNLISYGYYKDVNGKPSRDSAIDRVGLIGEFSGEIKNLTISANAGLASIISGRDNVAVIGDANNAVIENLYLNRVNVYGENGVGGVVGRLENSYVKNIQTNNTIVSGREFVGGLVGRLFTSTISNQYNKNTGSDINATTVYGLRNVGGAIGYLQASIIEGFNISASVNVYENETYNDTTATRIGGVVGGAQSISAGTDTFGIYEIKTGANIKVFNANAESVGGVVGYGYYYQNGSSKMENILHTGNIDITSPQSNRGHGIIVGRIEKASSSLSRRFLENIYTDSIRSQSEIRLVGVVPASGAPSLSTVSRLADVNAAMLNQTVPLAHGVTGVTVRSILESSSVWSLTGGSLIDINNFANKHSHSSETNSQGQILIKNNDDLGYVKRLTRLRLEDYSYKKYLLNGQISSTVRDIGTRIYPFVGSFMGTKTGASNSFSVTLGSVSSNNISLFGYVGVSQSLSNLITEIKDFNLLFSQNQTVNKSTSGLLIDYGRRVNINGINIKSSSSAIRRFNLNGQSKIGSVAGELIDSDLLNINFSQFNVINGGNYVGGIIGYANSVRLGYNGSLENIVNESSISGAINVGGIVGGSTGTGLYNAENKQAVSGNLNVGGILGEAEGSTVVSNSANSAQISGESNVGGIIGSSSGNTRLIGSITVSANVVGDNRRTFKWREGDDNDFEWWGIKNHWPDPRVNIVASNYQNDVLPKDVEDAIKNKGGFKSYANNYTLGLLVGNGGVTTSAANISIGSSIVDSASLEIRKISFEQQIKFSTLVAGVLGFSRANFDLQYEFEWYRYNAYTTNLYGSNSNIEYDVTFQTNNVEDLISTGEKLKKGSGNRWITYNLITGGHPHGYYSAKKPNSPYLELIIDDVKIDFDRGEFFSSSGLIAIYHANGNSNNVTSLISIDSSDYNRNKEGMYEIIVSYDNISSSYFVTVE